MLSRSGATVPRPLFQTLHASKPNDVLRFDYLFLGKSDGDKKYVFVVKDDFSRYAWVTPTDALPMAKDLYSTKLLGLGSGTTLHQPSPCEYGNHLKHTKQTNSRLLLLDQRNRRTSQQGHYRSSMNIIGQTEARSARLACSGKHTPHYP